MTAALGGSRPATLNPCQPSAPLFIAGRRAMKNRVITRKRGVIPGCIPVGPDSHMAVDSLGRHWPEVAKLPSIVDAWLAELAKKSGSRETAARAAHGRR
jgi:hypothetical protein